MTTNKHWLFLEKLRRSGKTNMYGATPWLEAAFRMTHEEAVRVLNDWMLNYNPKDYKEQK